MSSTSVMHELKNGSTSHQPIYLPDYVRDEIRFLSECYVEAKKLRPLLLRTDFCLLYTETGFPDLYQQYWLGNRHRPRTEDVVRACLEKLL